jgi:hypothetical protein
MSDHSAGLPTDFRRRRFSLFLAVREERRGEEAIDDQQAAIP